MNNGKAFILNAPGGTGKSFVLNTILAFFRAQNDVCIATAQSSIAAIFQGGKTCHSVFGIPICEVFTTSSITKRDPQGMKLMKSKFLIWDEVSM